MNTKRHLKRLLSGAEINTGRATDEDFLKKASAHLPAAGQGRTSRLGIAAVILLALGLVVCTPFLRTNPTEQPFQIHQIPTKNSLLAAYKQGGMTALEQQLDSPRMILEPMPMIRIEDLLDEIAAFNP